MDPLAKEGTATMETSGIDRLFALGRSLDLRSARAGASRPPAPSNDASPRSTSVTTDGVRVTLSGATDRAEAAPTTLRAAAPAPAPAPRARSVSMQAAPGDVPAPGADHASRATTGHRALEAYRRIESAALGERIRIRA